MRAQAYNYYSLIVMFNMFFLNTIAFKAAEHYVTPPGGYGTNNPPYTNWADAATNIQWAIDAASSGETVWVTNGVYYLTNQIVVSNRILRSMNGYSNTLVAADWPAWTTRCFYVSSNGVLDGFTVSNGHYYSGVEAGGGGAYLSTGTIQNCRFVNNICSNASGGGGGGAYIYQNGIISNCLFFTNMAYVAGSGGGIACKGGSIISIYVLGCTIISNYSAGGAGFHIVGGSGSGSGTISNCLIAFNRSADWCGGINLSALGVISDCVVSNNSCAQGGGGIYAIEGSVIKNSTIVKNTAGSGGKLGGGLYMNGAVYVTNCIIIGNQASGGAGIKADHNSTIVSCQFGNNITDRYAPGSGAGINAQKNCLIRNCLIYNNTNLLVGNGGGIYLNSAASNRANAGVINCTIVNNYSTNEGGGIAASGASNFIVNCIISGNRSFSSNYPDVYNTESNSNNYYYCCANPANAPLAPNQGNITNAPMFVDANGNWRLQSSSPCINTGTNQSWMTNAYDLDGHQRIMYGTVDIGAYEVIYEGSIYYAF